MGLLCEVLGPRDGRNPVLPLLSLGGCTDAHVQRVASLPWLNTWAPAGYYIFYPC